MEKIHLLSVMCTMSIEQLGSLGEFIAAIAVLISLVYLALQIRQNTKQVEQASFNDVYRAYSEMRKSIYSNDAMSDLLVKLLHDDDLTESELVKAQLYIAENLFCTLQMTRVAGGISGFTQENLDAGVEVAAALLESSVGREYWQQYRQVFPPDFQNMIDAHLPKECT